MTVSDDQLVDAVRESVAARSVAAGRGIDDVLQRGRRRTAARRGAAGLVMAAVLAGGAALGLGVADGLPLLSSAPPAAPSVTLSPDPSRTTALRPATDLYAVGDAAILEAGLPLSGRTARWGVARGQGVWFGASPGAPDDVSATTSGPGFQLTTAHVSVGLDPGATSCSEITQAPLACVGEPQDDGSVLFEVRYDGELVQYLLVHRTGFVRAEVMGPLPPEAGPSEPFEPADPERLRELVLDPTLRW